MIWRADGPHRQNGQTCRTDIRDRHAGHTEQTVPKDGTDLPDSSASRENYFLATWDREGIIRWIAKCGTNSWNIQAALVVVWPLCWAVGRLNWCLLTLNDWLAIRCWIRPKYLSVYLSVCLEWLLWAYHFRSLFPQNGHPKTKLIFIYLYEWIKN